MNLLNIKRNDSSDDEESDASSDESQESEGTQPMSDHPQTADSQSSDEESLKEDNHPYPTPPTDGDVGMPLRKDDKKLAIPIAAVKPNVEMENKMEAPKNHKPLAEMKVGNKGTIYSRSLDAIKTLNNRSGSSVAAIVKYLKSTGYEVAVEQRLPKLVLRALKLALVKEEVVQVKRSFKMSPTAMKTSKAVDKMRAKQEKQKQKVKKQVAKAKKQEAKAESESESESAEPEETEIIKKPKMKASERKTNAPVKKKPNAKMAAAAGNAKVAAGVKAQEAFEKSEKPAAKAKPAKANKATADMPASSKPIAKAKSTATRKAIGTLVPATSQVKLQVKSIKKLVAGKENNQNEDNFDSDIGPIEAHSTPIASATSIPPGKPKRKAR